MNILEVIPLESILAVLPISLIEKSTYYVGLCPFHNEKNPSFSIKKDGGYYKCFSCGEKGSIEKLFKELMNRDIKEYFDINNYDSLIFKNNIENKNKRNFLPKAKTEITIEGSLLDCYSNREVVEYLESRKIEKEFISYFNIQYCSMIKINETSFYNRLMIPCYNENKLVNYEGRDFKRNQIPKVLYPRGGKTNFLFNIDNVKRNEPIYVTEGIMGLSSIWQNVSHNVVSTFGASISKEKINKLNEFDEIIIFMDNDEAGERMIEEIENILEKEFYICKSKEKGKDPNDLTKEELYKSIDNKKLSIEYFLEKSKLFNEEKELKWF